MAATRSYLGQVVHLGEAIEQGRVTLEAKPNARHEAADELRAMAGADRIAQARASKIRGKVGWINSATYGRCGRFGTGVLKKFQYDPASGGRKVSADDAADLRMLAKMITIIPPRVVRVMAPPRPRVTVYSDASWEHEARLGWVVIHQGTNNTPQGRTSLVTDDVLDQLVERKTQIMACEAIAVRCQYRFSAGWMAGWLAVCFSVCLDAHPGSIIAMAIFPDKYSRALILTFDT